METQKGPYKDYSPGGYMGFHVSLGECITGWGVHLSCEIGSWNPQGLHRTVRRRILRVTVKEVLGVYLISLNRFSEKVLHQRFIEGV